MESWSLETDTLQGAVISVEERPKYVLVAGRLPEKLPGEVLHRGEITLRYGLAFLYEPDAFFVHRIIDDFGREFAGQDALTFAARRGDAFPRATVIGVRASTGEAAEIFLKQLDLARDALPVAYAHIDQLRPVALIDAALCIDDAAGWSRLDLTDSSCLPVSLIAAVPCYRVPSAQLSDLSSVLSSSRR